MSTEQEIRDLANKLLQTGVARSHMDAVEMAKSMVDVDLTPSGKKIDNLDAPNITVKEDGSFARSVQPEKSFKETLEVAPTTPPSLPASSSEPSLEAEIKKELSEFKTIDTLKSESKILPIVTEEDVECEIVDIESEPTAVPTYREKEIEQEMAEPDLIKEEQAIDSTETLSQVESEIIHIESESNSTSESKVEEMVEELAEPRLIKEEQAIDSTETLAQVENDILSVESTPDSFGEQELERELNPGEVKTTTGITAQTTDLEEYAAKKMAEQGAMNAPVSEATLSSEVPSAVEPVTQKETFILSNVSKDDLDEDSKSDSDGDITNIF